MTFPTAQLRRILRIVNGGTPTSDLDNWDGAIRWATPADLASCDGGTISTTARTLTEAGLASGSRSVPAGSLVLSTRAPIGYVAQAAEPMAFNQGCRGLEAVDPIHDSRYFKYQLLGRRADLQAAGSGTTFQELSTEALAAFRLVVPPPEAQQRIVDFLDAETARIDALIDAKVATVSLARERLQTIRLEEIYRLWESSRRVQLKRVLTKRQEPADPDTPVVTAYRDGEVTARDARRADGYTIALDESGYQKVERGDVVFHGLDGFAGACGVAAMGGRCSPVYHVCVVPETQDADFLALTIRCLALTGFVELQASSVRQRAVDLRNWDRFGAIEVPIVPLDVQRRASAQVRREESRTGELVSGLTRQIDLLRERRQALITAAVSGEMEVA